MKLVFILALLMIVPAIGAAELNHDYIDVGYFKGEMGESFLPVDFDGAELRGSKAWGNWLLIGDYTNAETDPLRVLGISVNGSSTMLHVGGGYVVDLPGDLELLPALGLVQARKETRGVTLAGTATRRSESDTGYFVDLGLRAHLVGGLEAEYSHRFNNVLSERINEWRADLRWVFTPQFAVSVGHRDFEDGDAVAVGLRWQY